MGGFARESIPALLQYASFLLAVTLLVKPVGRYMARVFSGEKTLLDPLLCPVERLIYRLTGVKPQSEMGWQEYAGAFVVFGVVGSLLLYTILRLQRLLPWFYPAYLTTPMTKDLAANTAVSFATTTTWQAYGGESTLRYLTQLIGLVAQNFLAGSAGLAVGFAFIRGVARDAPTTIGNFWVDLVRSLLWVLLPLALVGSLVLLWQGVPINLDPYVLARTLEGRPQTHRARTSGRAGIHQEPGHQRRRLLQREWGSSLANPTPLTNFLGLLAMAVLPAAFTHTYGLMVGRPRHGWVLYSVMAFLFTVGLLICGWAEQHGNPRFPHALNIRASAAQAGGNMEGKEVRFGITTDRC